MKSSLSGRFQRVQKVYKLRPSTSYKSCTYTKLIASTVLRLRTKNRIINTLGRQMCMVYIDDFRANWAFLCRTNCSSSLFLTVICHTFPFIFLSLKTYHNFSGFHSCFVLIANKIYKHKVHYIRTCIIWNYISNAY